MFSKKLTPLLRQYLNIKQEYNDCLIFFRLGDFYELFFEDAQVASKILGITLTKRGQLEGSDIPMCGVPHHQGDNYLAKLLNKGFKVAICEQTETPEESKKRGYKEIIKRKVVRIATPGTLTEEKELLSTANNYLMSVTYFENFFNIVFADISTGEINIKSVLNTKEVLDCIYDITPSELLIPKSKECDFILKNIKNILVTFLNTDYLKPTIANKYFEQAYFSNKKYKEFNFKKEEIISIGATIRYIAYTQNDKTPIMCVPYRDKNDQFLEIDNASKRNLEIIKTLNGDNEGSLFNSINYTHTATGARRLLNDLSNPLKDLKKINKRLDLVEFFHDKYDILQEDFIKKVSNFPDIARSLNRLSLGRGGPKDLYSICEGLNRAIFLCESIFTHMQNKKENTLRENIRKITNNNKNLQILIETLGNALGDNLPLLARDGNFIKNGFNKELDKVREYREKSKNFILEEEMKERRLSGISNLKIKFNSFLGYFIDISNSNNKKISLNTEHYIHRQTLKNSFRYTTKSLISISESILEANFKAQEIENEIYNTLVQLILNSSEKILDIVDIISRMDVAFSWACYAKKYRAVKPIITEEHEFEIQEGRHPSVEKTHTEGFIANNCILNYNYKNLFKLITGPNMSGKSTYLRQNALILIIAQAGGYCPAKNVKIGICDKLFCRVGSGDELAKGNSTFMVEMIETANILNTATNRSLVILDEIGRGTSTYDGMSLAWATIEYILDSIKCKALFATHYNQLAILEKNYRQLKLNTFKVKEWKGDLVFLHQLTQGVAESSYGIQVAKMAGLPEKVIISAKNILKNLEKSHNSSDNIISQKKINFQQKEPQISKLEEKINKMNLNNITPLEALNLLNKLKNELKGKN